MTENERSSRKRLLPSLLLASAIAAPAVAAPPDLGDLVREAERMDRHKETLIDSQASYSHVRTVTAPQWAEVTWGKITWIREEFPDV
ncbi:MAG TPA: hypothetical protein VHM02_12040 [Thermoanaerobaculia bacterium]|nr:hypothetical protein [Thermoanaerobaculia bacterium]